jgi:hypothetical protein
MAHLISKYLWLILIIAGLFIRHWINRRAFYRRNAAGVEEFSSYSNATLTRFAERVGKLIGFILIVVGIFKFFVWLYSR